MQVVSHLLAKLLKLHESFDLLVFVTLALSLALESFDFMSLLHQLLHHLFVAIHALQQLLVDFLSLDT